MEMHYDRGVLLPNLGLWLDPSGSRDLAFVSHAHSDHTGRHKECILTPETSRLMAARMGESPGVEHLLEYDRPHDFGAFTVTLIPAGHVLGSAQAHIESSSGTLLYTGDFKLRRGLTSAPTSFLRANTLVMETTFGRPHYVFPPAADVIAAVLRFCTETLEDGDTPVLLAYSLGKAQEILSALAGANFSIMLHGSIAIITKVYESLGVSFPSYQNYRQGHTRGHVVICPPNVNGSAMLQKIPRCRVAALSGWALDPRAIHRMRCDAVFPLSDHADYPELIQYVKMVQPQRVFTLHGFAQDFARDLRAMGIEAWALTGADQLELRLPSSMAADASSTPRCGEAPLPAGDITAAASHGFELFARLGAEIAATSGKLAKVRMLSDYFCTLSEQNLKLATTWLTGRAFSRTSETSLHLGWSAIRRALLSITGCTPSTLQAVSRRYNDAGLTTLEILKGQTTPSTWDLADAEAFFRSLAVTRAPAAKLDILANALKANSAVSAMMLVKIITGDLRIGLKEGLVEDAVAQAFGVSADMLREAHMLLGDLGSAAVRARSHTLDTVKLTPFLPVRAMLASPEPTAEAVWNRLASGADQSVWVEDKLDGIRAQIHAMDGVVEIYSRDLHKITSTFPEICAPLRSARISCVLDGEIIAADEEGPRGFFELQKRLGRSDPDLFMRQDIPVSFVAFDLLWSDGKSLFREPLRERRHVMESISWPQPIRVAEVTLIESAGAIEREFDAARVRKNEGLMIKDPLSSYLPGRRGMAWIKLKKAAATLDVVVTAVEYGHGRRREVLSDYTFSVRGESGAFSKIGKAYSGLTDAEISKLTPVFQKLTIRQRGRVFDVEPCIVLEVAFDSIQASTRHSSGLSLRFPRIVRIRTDKTPDEIDTVESASRLVSTE